MSIYMLKPTMLLYLLPKSILTHYGVMEITILVMYGICLKLVIAVWQCRQKYNHKNLKEGVESPVTKNAERDSTSVGCAKIYC